MRKMSLAAPLLAASLFLCIQALCSLPFLAAQPDAVTTQGQPLSAFLNKDGTLNLPKEGISGSIDPAGYQLASRPGEPPRFESAEKSAEPSADGDENWDSRFNFRGIPGAVLACAWDGTHLYVGGGFNMAGGACANNIAMWDGREWSALGSGLDGAAFSLAWDGTHLYAGGNFTAAGGVYANNIAMWDGKEWSALGSGLGGRVSSLAWDGTHLYAGGHFTTAGAVRVNGIAMWDGSSWSPLGSGMDIYFGLVDALVWDGTHFYAGGSFTTAGGVAANRIAMWDGSAWSPLGSGMDSNVKTLAWDGIHLYAGGNFTAAGGVSANNIAKWDGSAWSALGAGTSSEVRALAWDGINLYAGGTFATAGGETVNRVAMWNGSSWSALDSGMNSYSTVSALAWDGINLYAGGTFATAGAVFAVGIARWNGTNWSSVPATGSGMNFTVQALAWGGANLYAGGGFTTAGGAPAKCIAKWDGSAWSPLGSGMNDGVNALAWDGTNLYAGGYFTTAGGVPANYVAKWDGSAWSALGLGTSNYVQALAWDGANLYAGGEFTIAGEVTTNYIAKWDGSSWSALGSGMNSYSSVSALAWDGANLYAGGSFTTAGGVPTNYIAKWDGSSWSALGSGMDRGVFSLAWYGSNLYAGGEFETAGGTIANSIAKWDGSSWSALGSGMNSYRSVSAIEWDGANLYAGGSFNTVDGIPANCIAKWDGTGWSSLGSGMDSNVKALAWDGTGLYAGGDFKTAGGKGSSYIGRWGCSLLPGTPSNVIATPGCAGNSISWTGSEGAASYDLLRGTTCGTIEKAFTSATSPFMDSTAIAGIAYRYWVVAKNSCGNSTNSPCAAATRYPLPTPTVSGASIGCSSSAVVISTQSYAAYQWRKDRTDISGATASSYAVTASGSYSVKVTDSYGCSGTSPDFRVTISQNPVPEISGDPTGCASSGVALATGSYTSYQWKRGGANISGATLRTYIALQSGDYSVAVMDPNGCAGTSADHGVTLWTDPQPTVTGDSSGCPSRGAALATGTYQLYQWRVGGTDISGATEQNYTATASGTYTVWVTDNRGCTGISEGKAVTIYDNPVPTISGPTPACISGTLSTQAFIAYQWYLDLGLIPGATGQTVTATAPGSYTVRVTDSNGCSATSTPFIVNSTPAPSISGPSSGCGKVQLSTGAFSSYQWSLDSIPIPGATAQNYEADISGAYAVTVTSAEGCTGVSAAKAATVHPVPEPLISGPASGCGTVMLSTASFSSYRWLLDGAPLPGASGQSYEAGTGGSYSVEVTDSNGCSAVSPAVAVEVYQPPVPAISGSTEGCATRGVVLSTQPYVRYQWSLDGSELSGATGQSYTATASGSYSVSVVDASGCNGVSAAFPLKVNPAPAPSISGPSPACGSATLSTQSFSVFQWYLDGAAIPGATGQVYAASAPGSYTVGVVDANGCDATSPAFLVSPLPAPSVSGPSSGCSPVQLSTSSFLNYQWFRDGDPIPGATGQGYGATVSGDYAVTVTDSSGCQGTSPAFSVTVSICLPGDCDGSGVVSIGEVQKAINMFLGALSPDCGVDCDGDGQVSIGELQKVINAFLGLPASC